MYTSIMRAVSPPSSVSLCLPLCGSSVSIGWCQRIKSEFKFEYAYLEDELTQAAAAAAAAATAAGNNPASASQHLPSTNS
jgi:hypothetical protein